MTKCIRKSRIINFDFKNEEFVWTPATPRSHSSNKNLHLLTLRGSLAIATTSLSPDMTKIEMWVLTDYDKKVWMQDTTQYMSGVFCAFGLKYATCGDFFHHLSRNSESNSTSFLDLRSTSTRCCTPPSGELYWGYTGSLMSLGDYGNLGDGNVLVS